jgi:hypothetical protein
LIDPDDCSELFGFSENEEIPKNEESKEETKQEERNEYKEVNTGFVNENPQSTVYDNKEESKEENKEDDIRIETEIPEVNIKEEETRFRGHKHSDDIGYLLNKYDKKEKKKDKKDSTIMYIGTYLIEIAYTFIFSLFPLWSDQFEIDHPIIKQQAQNEQEIVNNELPPEFVQEEVNLEKEIQQVEMQNLKMENNTISHNSGDKPIKSFIDETRLVNNGNDNQKYYLVEENENKTENEYVFSENINIDNLSYTEPITTKKKYEEQ